MAPSANSERAKTGKTRRPRMASAISDSATSKSATRYRRCSHLFRSGSNKVMATAGARNRMSGFQEMTDPGNRRGEETSMASATRRTAKDARLTVRQVLMIIPLLRWPRGFPIAARACQTG